MRNLRRLAWAAVAALAAAAPASAQMRGGTTAPTGTAPTATGGNLGTFQNAPANTATTLNTAGSTGTDTGTGSSTGSTGTQFQLPQVEKAPPISAPSTYGKNPASIQSSNFLGPSFANPYASGILANTRSGTFTPGGFGDPTFGKAAAAKAGGTGATFAADPGGQIVQLPRQIAYTAQLKFTPPTIPAPRLQADLRGLIDRAGLTVPAGSVQVLVGDGNAVVLRGTVRDDDEARLVMGVVRLTPGVSRITNELNYPR
ncbi:MAG TPA: BON domain-containing protein [Urbifossiella sp.]|nr:BON domain-containing protein [Urbifossiella sp.]